LGLLPVDDWIIAYFFLDCFSASLHFFFCVCSLALISVYSILSPTVSAHVYSLCAFSGQTVIPPTQLFLHQGDIRFGIRKSGKKFGTRHSANFGFHHLALPHIHIIHFYPKVRKAPDFFEMPPMSGKYSQIKLSMPQRGLLSV
jgi:hypothetical protein